MRIHGVGAQYGRNLCPQNLRNNQVSFGKIDEDIKDEMYAMAERSPRPSTKTGFSNRELIDSLDEETNIRVSGNPKTKIFDLKIFIPDNQEFAYKWFKTDEGYNCCHNLNMEKIAKIFNRLCRAYTLVTPYKPEEVDDKHISRDEAIKLQRLFDSDS